jgi:hypothetical protein
MDLSLARLPAAIQSPIANLRTPSPAIWLGALVLALHLLLLPFVARTWQTTGDEPHYLLAAHSLTMDGDFDLANNYDQLDYLNFYFSQDIVRQVRLDRHGQQILDHQLALPLLIAPAYALSGRMGVLVFQVVVGALLAGLTYQLAFVVSQNRAASAMGAVFVSLSPPLFQYHYLVYPELIAALLTTLVVYLAIRVDKPGPWSLALTLMSLTLLPWLNRRFTILALALALTLTWAWRDRRALLALLMTAISIGALLWFNSGLSVPERVDITIPAASGALWRRLLRGVGWLVDQQRGLFVFGPIYLAAIFGLPFLFKRRREWLILIPFLVSLGVTVLAGGYWIAWELGPRFLVAALPSLGALLALAWKHYGRTFIGGGGMLLLFSGGLLNNWVILYDPELPYKSSLPLYYGQETGLALVDYLPDLAETLELHPLPAHDGFAAEGRPTTLLQTGPLHSLPFGHYRLDWRLRTAPSLPPDAELLRVSVQTLGGGQVFSHLITAADLPLDGTTGTLSMPFLNGNVDRWRTPLLVQAASTGQGPVWVEQIAFKPQPFYAWILPYLILVLLGLAASLAWWRRSKSVDDQNDETITGNRQVAGKLAAWGMILLLPVAALILLVRQQTATSHTYDVAGFAHFVGSPADDPDAAAGRAWLVDPLLDAPQKAIYGPFQFFDPGTYQVTFRLKLPQAVKPEQEVARLGVFATANFDPLLVQPLLGSHFAEPGLYHLFVLTVDNPRRQALSFEVYYNGLAALMIDEVVVERLD